MKTKIFSIILSVTMLLPCLGIGEASAFVTGLKAKELPFTDISENAWYAESAEFCYINGIIKGYGNDHTFAPNKTLDRATFAVMLSRLMGADLSGYKTEKIFNDVPADQWYTSAVEWAYKNGYMKGTDDKKSVFSPTAPMTREQVAVVICNIFDLSKLTSKDDFDSYKDAIVTSDWALDQVRSVVNKGIMGSTSANSKYFSPQDKMTRSQTAQIFMTITTDIIYFGHTHVIEGNCNADEYISCRVCGLCYALPEHYCPGLSCTSGAECIFCGKYFDADTSLHNYSGGGCEKDKICTVCGDVKKASGHNWIKASCTVAKYCKVCKITEGEPCGHDYPAEESVNCTEEIACKNKCGSSLPALGHIIKDGYCDRCKKNVDDLNNSEYYKLIDYLQSNYEDKTFRKEYNDQNLNKSFSISCDNNENVIKIRYMETEIGVVHIFAFITVLPEKQTIYYEIGKDSLSDSSMFVTKQMIVEGIAIDNEMFIQYDYSWKCTVEEFNTFKAEGMKEIMDRVMFLVDEEMGKMGNGEWGSDIFGWVIE